jgi:hypothetical protein
MTSTDILLEQLYKTVGDRPQRKGEETLTTFDRRIFFYDRDEVNRQLKRTTSNRVTYEDHRKAVETATTMFGNKTQHEIAMTILTHRFFADYRANAFEGLGGFTADYSFLIRKIGHLFDSKTSRVNTSTISTQLKTFKTPTLVQVNHLAGIVTSVTLPTLSKSLADWANTFNSNAPESTTYQVAGLSVA